MNQVPKFFDNPAERTAPPDARVPASVTLGSVEIRPATVLAPMAGITDTVFRRKYAKSDAGKAEAAKAAATK
ncbi:MAG TPA: hypothetical protein VMU45_01505 [Candidatus Eisenbacteria bacterium]|nr:hypothetical protein [Candidatus Eisenbacteria bacterium]